MRCELGSAACGASVLTTIPDSDSSLWEKQKWAK